MKKKRKVNSRKIVDAIQIVFIPIVILIIWEVFARSGALSKSILPAPSVIGKTWKEYILNGTYQKYLLISLQRFLGGFTVGAVLGLALGIAMGLSRKVNILFTGITGLLRPIPNVGWIPLVILMFGVHESGKIVLVAIGCFWSVFINTIDGIKSVDSKYLELADSLEKNTYITITKIVIPAAFPSILTGIKQGFSNSWKSIVAAEMIAASAGIGFMISYARQVSRPDVMYVGLVTVALIGLLLDIVVNKVQDTILARR